MIKLNCPHTLARYIRPCLCSTASKPGVSKLRHAGQVRPAKTFCQYWKNNVIYENFIDLVECNITRNNLITQDMCSSNCCATAHVVFWKKRSETLLYTIQPFRRCCLLHTEIANIKSVFLASGVRRKFPWGGSFSGRWWLFVSGVRCLWRYIHVFEQNLLT